ncbi:SAM domain (Sterile alpha motif) domain containing protein [Balamuthia mandrillaris]
MEASTPNVADELPSSSSFSTASTSSEEEDLPIEQVVQLIGQQLGRKEEEIRAIIQKMGDNWITRLSHWQKLSAQLKRALDFPLLLVHSLDKFIETREQASDEAIIYIGRTRDTLTLTHKGILYEWSMEEPLCTLLQEFGREEERLEKALTTLSSALSSPSHQQQCLLKRKERAKARMEEQQQQLKSDPKKAEEGAKEEMEKEKPKKQEEKDKKSKEEDDEETKEKAKRMRRNVQLLGKDEAAVPENESLENVLLPGRCLHINQRRYILVPSYEHSAVDGWLSSLQLEALCNTFARHGVDDFFSLPFLSDSILSQMDILESNRQAIMKAVGDFHQLDPVQFVASWIKHVGFPCYVDNFVQAKVTLITLRLLEDKDYLYNMNITDEHHIDVIWQEIEKYKCFSSVEETFSWLRRHGFAKYSFHFARYNIPFYALPFVNFFIIDEMGVTHDDQILLSALQQLKSSPAYCVKAIAYWLRDLEMEEYNVAFASNGVLDLETLTTLGEQEVNRLVAFEGDRSKMQEALKEMQEFQYYYSATALLLQELGMERYSRLFALHGISVDVLPFLGDSQLIDMGVEEESDRSKILKAVRKIKHSLPEGFCAAASVTTSPSLPFLTHTCSGEHCVDSSCYYSSVPASSRRVHSSSSLASSACATSSAATATPGGLPPVSSSARGPVAGYGLFGMIDNRDSFVGGGGWHPDEHVLSPKFASQALWEEEQKMLAGRKNAILSNHGLNNGRGMTSPLPLRNHHSFGGSGTISASSSSSSSSSSSASASSASSSSPRGRSTSFSSSLHHPSLPK